MRVLPLSLWLIGAVQGLAASTDASGRGHGRGQASQLGRLAGGFIVEYKASYTPLADDHVVIEKHVNSQTGEGFSVASGRPMHSHKLAFFAHSFVLTRDDGSTTEARLEACLLELPFVKAVWANQRHPVPAASTRPAVKEAPSAVDDGQRVMASRSVLNGPDGQAGQLLAKRASSSNSDQVVWVNSTDTNPLANPHYLTGVDRLHKAGIDGRGTVIAILDNGIDLTHPGFGGDAIGPDHKVIGGYDFSGDSNAHGVYPHPDADPRVACAGMHQGTSAAYVAAGLAYKYGMVGVAPGAKLKIYRISACDSGPLTDFGANATLAAFEAGADAISISFGGAASYPDIWGHVNAKIVASGTPVMVTAGFYEQPGLFQIPEQAPDDVPLVGSSESDYSLDLLVPGTYRVDGGDPVPIMYAPTVAMSRWTMPLEVIAVDLAGCVPLADKMPHRDQNFTSNQVLLLDAPCSEQDNYRGTYAYGTRNIVMVNAAKQADQSLYPITSWTWFNKTDPVVDGWASIDHATGTLWRKLALEGKKVSLDLPWKPAGVDTRRLRLTRNTLNGGSMSSVSGWGPSFQGILKPTFAAPGGHILIAIQNTYGGIDVSTGPSFATPYAAGVAALIRQAHPGISALEISHRLAATAVPQQIKIDWDDRPVAGGHLAPAIQQGAGVIDAWAAIHTNTIVDTAALNFNDTDNLKPVKFQITNKGSKPVTYKFTNAPAITVLPFKETNLKLAQVSDADFATAHLKDAPAKLTFSPDTVTIGPGQSSPITVTAAPPTIAGSTLPIYTGYANVTGDNGDGLTIPYLGFASRMRAIPVLDTDPAHNASYLSNITAWAWFQAGLGVAISAADRGPAPTFTLPRFAPPRTQYGFGPEAAHANVSLPCLVVRLRFGSPRAEVYAVADADAGAASGARRQYGPLDWHFRDDFRTGYSPAAAGPFVWNGALLAGGFVPDGRYRIRVRFLRINGDAADPGDWDAVESGPFELVLRDA